MPKFNWINHGSTRLTKTRSGSNEFAVAETEREAVEKARRKIADGEGAVDLQHKREVKD
jgi:hypothetical protein